MDFSQTAGGLIVAAVTGLGFLAARYPETFQAIYRTTLATVIVFAICGITYDIAVSLGATEMMRFVAPGQKAAAEIARTNLQIPSWIVVTVALSTFYLAFLDWLSRRLSAEHQQKEKKDDGAK